jgi:20S proteasome alpha/beta subunit
VTTIAYRDGVLAGDTRVCVGDSVYTDRQRKVWRLRDGRLFGWAGAVEKAEIMRRHLLGKGEAPVDQNLSCIIVEPSGAIRMHEGAIWVKQAGPYVALGTGQTAALAAMDAGASAIEAVRIGIKRDANSGGRVMSVKLQTKE